MCVGCLLGVCVFGCVCRLVLCVGCSRVDGFLFMRGLRVFDVCDWLLLGCSCGCVASCVCCVLCVLCGACVCVVRFIVCVCLLVFAYWCVLVVCWLASVCVYCVSRACCVFILWLLFVCMLGVCCVCALFARCLFVCMVDVRGVSVCLCRAGVRWLLV